MLRIIVCGSRNFADRDLLERKLAKLTARLTSFELITGACPTGADRMAEEWAVGQFPSKRIVRKRFPVDWNQHGKPAGPIRNSAMAEYAGAKGICIAFRNQIGPSPGTNDMVRKAKAKGMKVKVYKAG